MTGRNPISVTIDSFASAHRLTSLRTTGVRIVRIVSSLVSETALRLLVSLVESATRDHGNRQSGADKWAEIRRCSRFKCDRTPHLETSQTTNVLVL